MTYFKLPLKIVLFFKKPSHTTSYKFVQREYYVMNYWCPFVTYFITKDS